MVSKIKDQLSGVENEHHSSDSVITELEKRIAEQNSQSEELKCVIAALEARIAAMTADSITQAKKRAKGRGLVPSVTPPTRRAVDIQPFNAGRALKRASPLQQVPSYRRGYISPSRVNVDHPATTSKDSESPESPRITQYERQKRTSCKTTASTVFPVIQAGSRHSRSHNLARSLNRTSVMQLGDATAASRSSSRWGQGLQR